MRNIGKFISDSAVLRQAVKIWKQELPDARVTTVEVLNDLRAQTADLLDKRAEAWIGENKLVHAGAARKLAEELRRKI